MSPPTPSSSSATSHAPPIWLITGCSSPHGFGFTLCLLALSYGHRVIATSRTPSAHPALVSQIISRGGHWLPLDVTSADLDGMVQEAVDVYGKIDVLVNNAGYAILGALECFSEKECRDQMETNFFGPLNIIRKIVPAMRERRSGVIVNVSSTAGIEAKPSRSMYSGSKFALEAMSEALHHEMKPFGVRVLIVSPGGFRTNFGPSCIIPSTPLPADYANTITAQTMNAVLHPPPEYQFPGDVHKGSHAIFDVVMKEGQGKEWNDEWMRLPLGRDGAARWEVKLKDLRENLEGTRGIWEATDCHDVVY